MITAYLVVAEDGIISIVEDESHESIFQKGGVRLAMDLGDIEELIRDYKLYKKDQEFVKGFDNFLTKIKGEK